MIARILSADTHMLLLRPLVLLGCAVMLSACLQDRSAPVEQRGDAFYGRDGSYTAYGEELPRYDNRRRAPMSPQQDAKYIQDDHHQYGVAADVGSIGASDLPPEDVSTPVSNAANWAQTQPQATADAVRDTAQQSWQDTQADVTSGVQQVQTQAKEEVDDSTGWLDSVLSSKAPEADMTEKTQAATAQKASNAVRAATPSDSATTFLWPLKGEVLSDALTRKDGGIAIAGRIGEPVRSSAAGSVVHSGAQLKEYGTMVIIKHAGGYVTTYAHLSESVVNVGDDVIEGQLIGFVGDTGEADSPRLHFSIRQGEKPLNAPSLLK